MRDSAIIIDITTGRLSLRGVPTDPAAPAGRAPRRGRPRRAEIIPTPSCEADAILAEVRQVSDLFGRTSAKREKLRQAEAELTAAIRKRDEARAALERAEKHEREAKEACLDRVEVWTRPHREAMAAN